MFDIDTDILIEIATSSQVLLRGARYFQEGRVVDISIEDDEVHAQVKGSEVYDVGLYFEGGDLEYCECDCKAFEQYKGACKHIIAALLYLQDYNSKSLDVNKSDSLVQDDILDELSQTFEPKKSMVKVEYEMEFMPYQGIVAQMHMKMGLDRMYIVRNVKEFLKSLYENRSYKFGKHFVFNPMLHQLLPEDQEVIEKLLEIYEIEKSLGDVSFGGAKCFFVERYINLPYPYLKKIANAFNDTIFTAKASGSYIPIKATFATKKLPCKIGIERVDDSIMARMYEDTDLVELNTYYDIYLDDKKVYLCDKEDPAFPFFKGFIKSNTSTLEFEGDRKQKLLSLVPKFKDTDYIGIDKDIEELLIRVPMKLRVEIDKYKKGISLNVKFVYKGHEISPKGESKGDKFVVRECDKEQFVLKLLEDIGFVQKVDKFVLEDEDKIYTFAKDIAPKLSQMGDVYYTNYVKDWFDIKTPGVKSVLKSVKGNLLEINMQFDDVDEQMAENLLNAVKQKKRYFRLKDGSFITLEDEKIKDLGKILKDINKDEINGDTIHLSKYKMIGLMQGFQDGESFPIENTGEIKELIDDIVKFPKYKLTPPMSLAKILRNYQITGFKWLKVLGDNNLGGVLADDMGLGKTIQAISFMLSNKDERSLVVAPSTLVYNWEREIKKFAPSLSVLTIEGNKKQREESIEKIPNYDVIITSYPLIRNDIELYTKYDFHTCILDEAQNIKNPASLTAKSVKKINACTRFALTGTPIENSPGELWSIFDFVMPGYIGSYKKFDKDYQKPILDGDQKALDKLRKLIAPFILRRSKEQVLKELPEKIVTTITVDLTSAQQKLYKAYLVKIKGELEKRIETEGFEKSQMHIFTGLLRLMLMLI
jgi:hypothetical protein